MGKPVIKGTRLTVELILKSLAAGETIENLLVAYPRLTKEAIFAALYFAADLNGIINIDPEIMSSTPVFTGTRVPIKTLFDNLESGKDLDVFFANFPSAHSQVVKLLNSSLVIRKS